jgi:hypothetical protein
MSLAAKFVTVQMLWCSTRLTDCTIEKFFMTYLLLSRSFLRALIIYGPKFFPFHPRRYRVMDNHEKEPRQ